ncbi:MAG: hypothetical protein AAF196_00165 [Planctomycetota bacterium]
MKNLTLSSSLGALLLLSVGCSSTDSAQVVDSASDSHRSVSRPMGEDEARRLFVTEERLRLGIRPPVDRPSIQTPPRRVAEPEPAPGRITHAEAYRNSRRATGFEAQPREMESTPVGFLRSGAVESGASAQPTRFLEMPAGRTEGTRTFLDRPTDGSGRRLLPGVTMPGRIEQLRGPAVSARPGLFFDYVETPDPADSESPRDPVN